MGFPIGIPMKAILAERLNELVQGSDDKKFRLTQSIAHTSMIAAIFTDALDHAQKEASDENAPLRALYDKYKSKIVKNDQMALSVKVNCTRDIDEYTFVRFLRNRLAHPQIRSSTPFSDQEETIKICKPANQLRGFTIVGKPGQAKNDPEIKIFVDRENLKIVCKQLSENLAAAIREMHQDMVHLESELEDM